MLHIVIVAEYNIVKTPNVILLMMSFHVHLCSPATPPGTKVKLVGKVNIQNSFLLLKKTSLEVLGGTVEVLYKKWNSQKVRHSANVVPVIHVAVSIHLDDVTGQPAEEQDWSR